MRQTLSQQKIEGIIVRCYPSGEADLVLKIISKSQGKCAAIAKQARKSRKRFSSSFDIFDRGTFEIKQGRGSLAVIQSYNPTGSFRHLRENLDKLTAASLVCEAFDLLIPEATESSNQVFEILALGLKALEEAAEIKAVFKACFVSLNSLLRISGYLNPADDLPASANNLKKLLLQIENSAGRELQSKALLLATLAKLK